MHPKMVEAEFNAKEAAYDKARIKEALKIAHDDGFNFLTVGLHTFCYKVKNHDVVEFSVALRNPSDKINRNFGRHLAYVRFQDERTVVMRKNGNDSVKFFFQLMVDE